MEPQNLPQPTDWARAVTEVMSVVIEAIPVVGGVLTRSYDIGLNRKVESNMNLIVEKIKQKGITILDDVQISYLIPAAFRFAEQVRLGDYDHTLKLLRGILVDGIESKSNDAGRVGRHARQLEYLSEFEIDVLSAAFETQGILAELNHDAGFINSEMIKVQVDRFKRTNPSQIKWALNVLNARGLLILSGASVWDGEEDSYQMSPDGNSIISSAMRN